MAELTLLPAIEMAARIREKKLSPVDLVEVHLERIETLNPKLNAFIQVNTEKARQQARAAEKALTSGDQLGPLHGVPVSIKSSIAVAGLRC
jgi:Asp-tRNA(Asn)/Glu-tRNA(Gln) amidotransferase A subunit family amidase